MRWGVCIVTLDNVPRATGMPVGWFDKVFSDPDGVANYFQQMSGGRENITYQIFGPENLLKVQEKSNLDVSGAAAVIAALRDKASKMGIPVDSFDHFLWILDDGISTRGTTPPAQPDSLLGALDFEPQLAMHEMTHLFGVQHHADRYQPSVRSNPASYQPGAPEEYADPFCVMGKGSTARSFPNPGLTFLSANFTHDTTGPGICAPYLYVTGWLDYQANVVQIEADALEGMAGNTLVTLDANHGAPQPGKNEHIALTIGKLPRQSSDPSQYWIEYRHPSAFDRGIDKPVSTTTPDLPSEGALILREGKSENTLHSYLIGWVPASLESVLELPLIGYALRVADVDATGQRLTLAIEHVQPLRIESVTLSPDTVVGGDTTTVTVTLDRASLLGDVVVEISGHPFFAPIPKELGGDEGGHLTIPQNSRSAKFVITTPDISCASGTAEIMADYLKGTDSESFASARLRVKPGVATGALASLTLSSPTVIGGQIIHGTITLEEDAPTEVSVALAAMEPDTGLLPLPENESTIVSVDSSVPIPAGSRTAKFTIRTQKIPPGTGPKHTATIIAGTCNTKFAVLTIIS